MSGGGDVKPDAMESPRKKKITRSVLEEVYDNPVIDSVRLHSVFLARTLKKQQNRVRRPRKLSYCVTLHHNPLYFVTS